jgi:hypothetical protein
VGVTYTSNAYRRTAEEVAGNGVFPEQQPPVSEPTAKAQHRRYLASIQRPKREVMRDIKRAVPAEHCDDTPLMGVMEGAQSLGNAFQEVCKDIKNQVMILDIIHVLEYIWLMASVKYPAVDDQAKSDVYETLTLIFQGKVASYILELQNEMLTGKWKKSQKETLKKVITYLRNHKQYMK